MVLSFIGTSELIIIAGVALLFFGGKKLPELMKGLGKGVKEFKDGMNGDMSNKEYQDSDDQETISEVDGSVPLEKDEKITDEI